MASLFNPIGKEFALGGAPQKGFGRNTLWQDPQHPIQAWQNQHDMEHRV
jgi:hypothetical protein